MVLYKFLKFYLLFLFFFFFFHVFLIHYYTNKKPKRLESSQLLRKTWHVNLYLIYFSNTPVEMGLFYEKTVKNSHYYGL